MEAFAVARLTKWFATTNGSDLGIEVDRVSRA
jgi:hypothetical protein